MEWIFPNMLFALGLIAIPVIIHLIQLRKHKKIVISDLRFIKAIIELQNKSKIVKNYWILLSRILGISLLVFVFAQPYFNTSNQPINQFSKNAIYIDNSWSMQNIHEQGDLLEFARQNARNIISSANDGDLFQIISSENNAKFERWVNKKTALQWIDEIKIQDNRNNIVSIINKINHSFEGQYNSFSEKAFILSDFSKNILDTLGLNTIQNINYSFVPLFANSFNNVFIDSVYSSTAFIKPNQAFSIICKCQNFSSNAITDLPVRLYLDNELKSQTTLNTSKNTSADLSFELILNDTFWHEGLIQLKDHPITFDDQFYFTCKAKSNLNVLLVQDQQIQSPFALAISTEPFLKLNNAESNHFQEVNLKNKELVILEENEDLNINIIQPLINFVENGGNVIFIPNQAIKNNSTSLEFLKRIGLRYDGNGAGPLKIESINTKSQLFSNVFEKNPSHSIATTIDKYYYINPLSSQATPIIILENKQPLVYQSKIGKGKVFTLALSTSDKQNNFKNSALFVPMILNAVLNKNGFERLYYTLDFPNKIELPISIKGSEFNLEKNKQNWFIQIQKQANNNCIDIQGLQLLAGNYSLKDLEKNEMAKIALNNSRVDSKSILTIESDLEKIAASKNIKIIEPAQLLNKSHSSQSTSSFNLWRWFLIGAIIMFLLEMFLFNKIRKNNLELK